MTGEQVWADYADLALHVITAGIILLIISRVVRAAVGRWFSE
jgi:hypothetical protein